MATHGRSGWRHLTLGSTTEKVIRSANCPILVVRERMHEPVRHAEEGIVLQKILVPIDFSDCAGEGACYASTFGTAVGADLLLMHVVQPPDYMALEGPAPDPHWPPMIETAVLAAENELDEILNFLPLIGIKAEAQVEVGQPVEKLAEASARPDIDLIVTSTHGYSGLRHALLGSVTEQLVRVTQCPILVVPSHRRN